MPGTPSTILLITGYYQVSLPRSTRRNEGTRSSSTNVLRWSLLRTLCIECAGTDTTLIRRLPSVPFVVFTATQNFTHDTFRGHDTWHHTIFFELSVTQAKVSMFSPEFWSRFELQFANREARFSNPTPSPPAKTSDGQHEKHRRRDDLRTNEE